jgi:hypothetical protein
MWLTPEQIRAEAQKSLAAGNILETAKEIKDAVSRASIAHPAHHQHEMAPSGTQEPTDPYERVVQDLQYGIEPGTVARTLKQTIAADIRAAAQEQMVRERYGHELGHRKRSLEEFQAGNPELAADPYARAAITQEVHQQYLADLKALGVPEAELPRDATAVADWHMQARVQGQPVRDMTAIFDAAKARYLAWRGGKQTNAVLPSASRPTAPRIELSADRTQRRAAVPTQPTRASVPPAEPAPLPPGGDRSAAILAMRRARGQIVG